jgi:type II restriction/modification system DNA methylase subunit YeeA
LEQIAKQKLKQKSQATISLAALETEINTCIAKQYGLTNQIDPDVSSEDITLDRTDEHKIRGELLSYAIGCMMGRYSLDEPGLIYAHAGNEGFDPTRYTQFPADADGILPLTDTHWFPDDTAARVREFVRAVWGPDTLEENLAWLAESLGQKTGETPDETLRRYLADKFFKDHLQTYKKRPIYWLFSSGKQGAFQCLVYLHRYHAGTLARLRADYVLPLTGKMAARLDSLDADIRAASSTAARTRLTKQRDALRKQQHELLAYDEKLRHYADQRISIDLDDGVKVNYGKFGDLLAEVKAVTGGTGDD